MPTGGRILFFSIAKASLSHNPTARHRTDANNGRNIYLFLRMEIMSCKAVQRVDQIQYTYLIIENKVELNDLKLKRSLNKFIQTPVINVS